MPVPAQCLRSRGDHRSIASPTNWAHPESRRSKDATAELGRRGTRMRKYRPFRYTINSTSEFSPTARNDWSRANFVVVGCPATATIKSPPRPVARDINPARAARVPILTETIRTPNTPPSCAATALIPRLMAGARRGPAARMNCRMVAEGIPTRECQAQPVLGSIHACPTMAAILPWSSKMGVPACGAAASWNTPNNCVLYAPVARTARRTTAATMRPANGYWNGPIAAAAAAWNPACPSSELAPESVARSHPQWV